MQEKNWTYEDKSQWGRGEWDGEPDKMQWLDANTGLPCLIVRNRGGALCGYVGVTEGHPMFAKNYDELDVDVHGGLTFANFCSPEDKEHGICHMVEKGEDDHVWWLGFDCSHAFDRAPAYEALGGPYTPYDLESYRNVEYVKSECRSLAAQLRAPS